MNILLADDHLMALEGYKAILNHSDCHYLQAANCEEIHTLITAGNTPDVAVIDHDMPSYPEQNLETGAEAALWIRQSAPECKIILITAHEEALLLYAMHRKVRPDALIVKSDFTTAMFRMLVLEDIADLPYLSLKAQKAIRGVANRTTLLDPVNRELLMYLSHGFKIVQIEDFVGLSASGIQKRVSKMLQEFGASNSQELVMRVKNEGFL